MSATRKDASIWRRFSIVVFVALVAGLLSGCLPGAVPTPGQSTTLPQVFETPLPTATLVPDVEIVIAVQEIPRGVIIAPDMIELVPWSEAVVPFLAFTSLEEVVGLVARTDIYREQPVLQSMVVPQLSDLVINDNRYSIGLDAAAVIPLNRVAVALPPGSVEVPAMPVDALVESPETTFGINNFEDASQDHLSTFAMDVDTASYTLARSYLMDYSQMPPADAIRPEEFINYFPPKYAQPVGGKSFSINMNATPALFGEPGNLLVRVGIMGRSIAPQDRQPALLVFVIDISGSMNEPNRLGMVKEVLPMLVNELRDDDRVSIVVYADSARVVLQPTPASEKPTILGAIGSLDSEGSTYAEAGLMLGYNVARNNMRPDTITHVILLSDGVANVGATGPDQILQTIHQGVDEGVTLSAIGFGMGDFNDALMEQLANDGNGNYFYVDNLREARQIFVNNLTSTLQVIGYDAKIQVDFNPDVVSQYRLIGYENRAVADQDFRNDAVDAGEVGAGHYVTALYEVTLKAGALSGNLATAYIRYEDADTREVVEQNAVLVVTGVLKGMEDAPSDFRLQSGVAAFAEMLRGSPYVKGSYNDVLALLQPIAGNDAYAAEVVGMLQRAKELSGQ